jgi:hypothetical protein
LSRDTKLLFKWSRNDAYRTKFKGIYALLAHIVTWIGHAA